MKALLPFLPMLLPVILLHSAPAEEEAVKPPPPPPELVKEMEAEKERWRNATKVVPEKEEKTDGELVREELLKAGEAERNDRVKGLRETAKHANSHQQRMALEEKAKSLDRRRLRYYPSLELKAGSIGIFRGWEPNVSQPIDSASVRVSQVVDGRRSILVYYGEKQIWVDMMKEVTNLADGDVVRLSGLYRYVGTRQYTTILGATRTVDAIEWVADE